MARTATYLLILALATAGCSDDAGERTFSEPDSGADTSSESDATSDSGEQPGDTGLPDAERDSGEGPDVPDGNTCLPNSDGVVERGEVVIEAGLAATFKVASDTTFDTEAVSTDDGLLWDMSGDVPGDQLAIAELRDPAGSWFEGEWQDITYITELSSDASLLGVFRATDAALLLLGVVSVDDDLFKTQLSYDPPVPVLTFPLSEGASWSVESTVSGQAQGVPAFYNESYDFEVDAAGTLLAPLGTFDVLRVRTRLTREVGLLSTEVRSFAFVSECFGTVATVRSADNPPGVEFTEVSEIRRLGR